MFQTFDVTSSPETGAARVAALRTVMKAEGVQAFLVPRADAHQGEYVADRDARLQWLTGFSGSAGIAVIGATQAAVFVDGRYTLQAQSQVDGDVFEIRDIPKDKPSTWLAEGLSSGDSVGYSPWLHTQKFLDDMTAALDSHGITLVPVDNFVDRVWDDQPPPPKAAILPYPTALAGKAHSEKRAEIAHILCDAGAASSVLTLPDSICWLLNIRGNDIPRIPVVQAFAIVMENGAVTLITDPAKLTDQATAHLGDEVTVIPPEEMGPALDALTGPVALDKATAPLWIADRLRAAGVEIIWQRDPCSLPKACKTEAELNGSRAAHLRDGAAMVEFLAWLAEDAPKDRLTEIDVVRALEGKRRATNALKDISFETISGAGPNGAIVHYRVSDATNRAVNTGELLLVDSGGQYEDGTTDITRTVAIGPPPEEAARAFTLVLKGMIAISCARWPAGLAGRDLDALARIALWQAGMDYDHGTGHGVGAYLSVHEGPQNLSRRGTEPLKPGMILSNEPGYYRTGAFGIRIENLVVVQPPSTPKGGDREMLGFETLTLAPIDRSLIVPDLLTHAERDWLNTYHTRVRETLTPLVTEPAKNWLNLVTEPIVTK